MDQNIYIYINQAHSPHMNFFYRFRWIKKKSVMREMRDWGGGGGEIAPTQFSTMYHSTAIYRFKPKKNSHIHP